MVNALLMAEPQAVATATGGVVAFGLLGTGT